MTPKKFLQHSRSLISKEENWCQGRRKIVKDNGASSFCMLGAMMEVECKYNVHYSIYERAHSLLTQALLTQDCGPSIMAFNDTCGRWHSEVLKVFDKAIAIAY